MILFFLLLGAATQGVDAEFWFLGWVVPDLVASAFWFVWMVLLGDVCLPQDSFPVGSMSCYYVLSLGYCTILTPDFVTYESPIQLFEFPWKLQLRG